MAEFIKHCTNCKLDTVRSPVFTERNNGILPFNKYLIISSCYLGKGILLDFKTTIFKISLCHWFYFLLFVFDNRSWSMEANKCPSEMNLNFPPNSSDCNINQSLSLQNKGNHIKNITSLNTFPLETFAVNTVKAFIVPSSSLTKFSNSIEYIALDKIVKCASENYLSTQRYICDEAGG